MRTNRHQGFILIEKRKQHPSPGEDASTPEPALGKVGRGEQSEARRANSTPNGEPHLELGRLRLKTWSNSDFSIAQTTYQHSNICTSYMCLYVILELMRAATFISSGLFCSNQPVFQYLVLGL